MQQKLSEISIETRGEGFTDVTPLIDTWIKKNRISQGILILSLKHTSCSLIINENADPLVLEDLSNYMKALVPEKSFKSLDGKSNSQKYKHSNEGVDDMPAHIRTALTCSCLSLSINNTKLILGTWQAIYLWEHRYSSHLRKISLHAIGQIEPIQQLNKDKLTKSQNISRRNPVKLNKYLQKNQNFNAYTEDKVNPTEIDVIIDRIHDLTQDY